MNWLKSIIARPWLTILSLNLHTMFGKPYFKVIMFHNKEIGQVAIDAHYNVHFLYQLDAAYARAGSDYYEPGLEEQAKIAIYMYDTAGGIAENYMPPEELILGDDDIAPDVPGMAFRGGEEVRQVVDLADHPGNNPKSSLDVKMG